MGVVDTFEQYLLLKSIFSGSDSNYMTHVAWQIAKASMVVVEIRIGTIMGKKQNMRWIFYGF
jgi:hypothetical protein